jgi:hypothetical protein
MALHREEELVEEVHLRLDLPRSASICLDLP